MDLIKQLMDTQLTEKEIMVFLLLEDKLYSQSSLGRVLLTNQMDIKRTYVRAQQKLDKMASVFSTPVE